MKVEVVRGMDGTPIFEVISESPQDDKVINEVKEYWSEAHIIMGIGSVDETRNMLNFYVIDERRRRE